MIDSSFYVVTRDGRCNDFECLSGVIALGTFDGVHVAHKSLLESAIELKNKIGAESVGAWCFSESPAKWLSGNNIPSLCQADEKIALMLSLGLDFVAVGDFRDFCDMSAEDFIETVLKGELSCVGAACGFNHRFGHKGAGNPRLLIEAFGEDSVEIVPEIRIGGETVSSSAIRKHIISGEIESARLMLGRPFSLRATVVSGKHLGHTLGFPTANQPFPKDTIIPKRGIYATVCTTEDGRKHIGISNVGIRPTITDGSDDHVTNCETYIHNFQENIYGRMLTVEFYKYLREEKKFDSIKSLRDQIARDLKASIAFFENEHPEALS